MKEFSFADHLEELDNESKYLVHKAKEATAHAYAPCSRFMVGCAVLLETGNVITGTNQENAAYPSGMCAERVALYTAAAQFPEMKITKVAVVARKKSGKDLLPASCCGPCRQVLLEFESRQHELISVIMQIADRRWLITTNAASLLPFGFGRADLEP